MLLNCGAGEDSWEPLVCMEIQSVHPKRDQSWVFIGSTDVEAETPILWPPDAKSWLIWKDPDAGKDWMQEEKGTTKDEMVGWHRRLNRHEFGWTPGVGDGQGGLACWGFHCTVEEMRLRVSKEVLRVTEKPRSELYFKPNTWGFLHGASSLSAYTRSVSCHTLSCYFFPWTSEILFWQIKTTFSNNFGTIWYLHKNQLCNPGRILHQFQYMYASVSDLRLSLKMQGINQEDQSRSQSKRTWISPPLTNTSKTYLCVERFSRN